MQNLNCPKLPSYPDKFDKYLLTSFASNVSQNVLTSGVQTNARADVPLF